ncbi:sigma-54 interaction domain-containing protein [Neolewinella litorea]|uniref:Sigma-54-dependent Fis family transcriptional regulator n=1 Tax=Neolewinella litorea TaxID=2562452 RepID=A0A4S4NU71_9BACT|nr:sigma 54-interacting transcriptional regulator [Neolewinella litorea]THH42051.1 sigma-54-dependent Fis family transcriptional regulator [Neolewinella litorea]
MPDNACDIGEILETIPIPGFLAHLDGGIVYANKAMMAISGQPALVDMDRTVFGLGIFHNPAEFRGFIQSFKLGGSTRRLVLPVGRLTNSGRPLVLFASRVSYRQHPALFGVISPATSTGDEILRSEPDDNLDALLDKVETYTLRVHRSGRLIHLNLPLLIELGYDRRERTPPLRQIDAENDAQRLTQLMDSALVRGDATYETSFQRKDGTLFPVKVVVKPIRKVEFKDQFMLTAYDLTERRNQQQREQAMEIKLERMSKELERRQLLIKEKFGTPSDFTIISKSPAYARVLEQVNQVAATDSTVLITGETGTGKELIARAIHAKSLRANRPLLILNCGALPADLIESELFGYRRGAFTGARADHLGRFELADEGTLFLDEIGEMPMLLQTRLLRVLQDGEFTPLGATESIQTDVRIIAATNRNLRKRVAEGTFRSDLYFRLNVFPIHSLPLRERREDIPALIDHFIQKHAPPNRPLPRLRPQDLEKLINYDYEGNVRELENIIQRALIISTGDILEVNYERHARSSAEPDGAPDSIPEPEVLDFEEMQRRHIMAVLSMTEGKVSGKGGAAELLGLNAQTLFSKMRKLGISRQSTKYSPPPQN